MRRSKRNADQERLLSAHPLVPALVLCLVSLAAVATWMSLDGRRNVLWYLLIPDELCLQWLGNDPARFGLLDRIPLLLITGWILLVALALGRLVLDVLRVGPLLSRGEAGMFSVAIGLNFVSLATLGFGLAGQMNRWWFVALTLMVIVGAGLRWRNWLREVAVAPPNEANGWTRTAIAVSVLFAILILLEGMVPSWNFDVREYHLQVPKEWYRQGYVGFLPHNIYGNMPMGVEMHALLSMMLWGGSEGWWWGAMSGKAVIAAFAPLVAWATYLCGRRFFDGRTAAVAAVVLISTPWVAHISMTGLIDIASAFYAIAAVHACLILGQRVDGEGNRLRWGMAMLAGLLAGAGVACKYPAVVFLVAPLYGWILLRRLPRIAWFASGVFLLGIALSCGPWLAKNFALTGNPTYPLLYDWFDGKTRTPAKDEQWRRAHTWEGQPWRERYGLGQMEYCLSLITWSSDYASPIMFPLAVVGLFSSRYRRTILLLAGFCAYVILAWWALTHRVDRFLVPLLPLGALIAGAGATMFHTQLWNRGVGVLLACGMVCCLCIDSSRILSDNRFLVSLKDLRRDAPNPNDPEWFQVHPAHRYLNETVLPGNCALLVGEAQVFNLEVPILYNTCFDDCQFESLMKGKTREQRYETLREHRITHVLVSWYELDRYRSPGNYGYSSYITRSLVRHELCQEQGLFRRVFGEVPDMYEVLEVVGWQDWDQGRGNPG